MLAPKAIGKDGKKYGHQGGVEYVYSDYDEKMWPVEIKKYIASNCPLLKPEEEQTGPPRVPLIPITDQESQANQTTTTEETEEKLDEVTNQARAALNEKKGEAEGDVTNTQLDQMLTEVANSETVVAAATIAAAALDTVESSSAPPSTTSSTSTSSSTSTAPPVPPVPKQLEEMTDLEKSIEEARKSTIELIHADNRPWMDDDDNYAKYGGKVHFMYVDLPFGIMKMRGNKVADQDYISKEDLGAFFINSKRYLHEDGITFVLCGQLQLNKVLKALTVANYAYVQTFTLIKDSSVISATSANKLVNCSVFGAIAFANSTRYLCTTRFPASISQAAHKMDTLNPQGNTIQGVRPPARYLRYGPLTENDMLQLNKDGSLGHSLRRKRKSRSKGVHKNLRSPILRPQEKSIELCMILAYRFCPPAGIVGDFFAGTASMALACIALGRHYLGIEIDRHCYIAAYNRMAETFTQHYQQQRALEELRTKPFNTAVKIKQDTNFGRTQRSWMYDLFDDDVKDEDADHEGEENFIPDQCLTDITTNIHFAENDVSRYKAIINSNLQCIMCGISIISTDEIAYCSFDCANAYNDAMGQVHRAKQRIVEDGTMDIRVIAADDTTVYEAKDAKEKDVETVRQLMILLRGEEVAEDRRVLKRELMKIEDSMIIPSHVTTVFCEKFFLNFICPAYALYEGGLECDCKKYHVEVFDDELPGLPETSKKGLRARKQFRPLEFIAPYYGPLKCESQIDEMRPDFAALKNKLVAVPDLDFDEFRFVIDGHESCAATYCNDPMACKNLNRGEKMKLINARLVYNEGMNFRPSLVYSLGFIPTGCVMLQAVREINPGDPIYISYGDLYWEEQRRQFEKVPQLRRYTHMEEFKFYHLRRLVSKGTGEDGRACVVPYSLRLNPVQSAELDIITQLPRDVLIKLPPVSQVGFNDAYITALLRHADRNNKQMIIALRRISMMLALEMPVPDEESRGVPPEYVEKVKKATGKVRLRYDPRFQFVKELNKKTLQQMFKSAGENEEEISRLHKFSVELGEGKPIEEVATTEADLPFVSRIYREMHYRECFKVVSRQLPIFPLSVDNASIPKKATHRKAAK
jgi:hypothetical protein